MQANMSNDDKNESKLDKLKKTIFSSDIRSDAVRDKSLKSHSLRLPHDFDEADELERRRIELKKIRENDELEKLNKQYINTGQNSHFGHYSPADKAKEHTDVNTKIFGTNAINGILSSNMSQKIKDNRAIETENRMRMTNAQVSISDAGIKGKNDYYSNIKKHNDINDNINNLDKNNINDIDKNDKYHPDLNIYNIGGKNFIEEKHNFQNDQDVNVEENNKKSNFSLSKIIFLIFFIFFSYALYFAYNNIKEGKNLISADNIDIIVTGPLSVKAGVPAEFLIDITNRNNAEITLSDLIVDFPQGSKSVNNIEEDLKNLRLQVGSVKPGQTVRVKYETIFYGEENNKKRITQTLEYNVPESLNIFSKRKDIDVIITGQPLTVVVSNIKEVTNNQELTFDIEVISNSTEKINSTQLKIEYPFGYKILEASLKPDINDNTWNLGNFEPGEKKTINIKGKLIGTNNLNKNFRFILGITNKNSEMISVINTQDQKVLITAPFILTTLDIDGNFEDIQPLYLSENKVANIQIINNQNTLITDVLVSVKILGNLIDEEQIEAVDGYYKSLENTIYFDKNTNKQLEKINPGQTVNLTYSYTTVPFDDMIAKLRKTGVKFVIDVKAKRLNEKNVSEEIISTVNKDLRLATNIDLTSGVKLENDINPTINKESIYIVTNKITNTTNAIKNIYYTAKFESATVWKNSVSENIKGYANYSENEKSLNIKIGDLAAGESREFKYQIGYTPSSNQIGQTPSMIKDILIIGDDTYTGLRVSDIIQSIIMHKNIEK